MSNDLFDELEAMAEVLDTAVSEVEHTARRWQKLFNMDHSEAVAAITNFRSDLNRVRLTTAQWHIMAPSGTEHDKESFEFFLEAEKHRVAQRPPQTTNASHRPTNPNLRWIFRPVHPLDTTAKIKQALKYTGELEVVTEAQTSQEFVICDLQLKQQICHFLQTEAPHAKPTFVEHSLATKQLSCSSRLPTLGVDTTMPQFRSDPTILYDHVGQRDWPVPYFFYGSLTDADRLTRLLGLVEVPRLHRATIQGGILREWKGVQGHAYKALVDASPEHIVHGHVFEVQDENQEQALRSYETARYEVVRCAIHIEGGKVIQGLTFRFVDYGELI